MSVNYLPQMPAIKLWLESAKNSLSKVGITSAQLDSELILSDCLNKDRTYLHAHCDDEIDEKVLKKAEYILDLRTQRTPMAYLLGYKYFYGRKFNVTSDTLIPRPESEDIINILEKIIPTIPHHKKPLKLVDVGSGSGCLGITAKLEFKALDVTLLDISQKALEIADKNASELQATVNIIQSDLFKNFNDTADIIIANLPYVDHEWQTSPETKFEPESALYADNKGLETIEEMIKQSHKYLNKGGHLLIEADPVQHEYFLELSKTIGFEFTHEQGYVIAMKLCESFNSTVKRNN